ncbi:MAG: hypothetical protein H7Z75_05310 [Ferruginibacter sp.]|nr:hypothetical protein [Cytophagales bacterium]
MNKCFLPLAVLLATGTVSRAQVNVAYHQSSLPFASVSYDLKRFHPDLRISTDVSADDLSAELTLNYKFLNREDFYFYGGLGGRVNAFAGLVIPVGVTVFPFNKKSLGFHAEIAVIGIGDENDPVLRGSWGIKFQFPGKGGTE